MGFPSVRSSAIVSVTGPYYAKVEVARFICVNCWSHCYRYAKHPQHTTILLQRIWEHVPQEIYEEYILRESKFQDFQPLNNTT